MLSLSCNTSKKCYYVCKRENTCKEASLDAVNNLYFGIVTCAIVALVSLISGHPRRFTVVLLSIALGFVFGLVIYFKTLAGL